MGLFGGYHIFFQGGGDAVTLGLLGSRENRGVVNAIGIVMDLLSKLDTDDLLDTVQWRVGQVTDGADL